jgi:Plasmid encoded RepA protein
VEHVKSEVCRIAHTHSLDLFVSKGQRKRIESVELVREERDRNQQTLAFNARPFVLCGLPIRRPPPGKLQHSRRNGRFKLDVIAHPEYGLPFGQDRLIPIWVATLAVRQKSRTVLFDSAAQILEEFDLPRDGPHYKRLVDGFKRLFTSTIYFGTDTTAEPQQVWDCRRFHFFDRLRLWCNRSPEYEIPESPSAANIIGLSESFWREIAAHPIPVDLRVVRELTNIPGCLDLYMWLCWRCFHAKRTENIPLFGSFGLACQLGVVDYSRDRNFRKRMREWLKLIRLYWPDCPARITADGMALTIAASCGIHPSDYNPKNLSACGGTSVVT